MYVCIYIYIYIYESWPEHVRHGTGRCHGRTPQTAPCDTAIFHTNHFQTKNLWVKIPKSLRKEIRRCTKKAHLLCLRIRLTQTPNLEILSLKIDRTPNLPKIIPARMRWLEPSGRFPTGLRMSPLGIKILLESNPLKSRILVRRLAVRPISLLTLWISGGLTQAES